MLFLLNKKVFREKHVYNPHNKVFKNVLLGTSIKKTKKTTPTQFLFPHSWPPGTQLV